MSDNDVLVELLGSPEIRTIRKPENILGRGNGDSDDASGYDLTNPNLHHGADEIYQTGPPAPTLTDQSAYDDSTFSSNVSGHSSARAAYDALSVSSPLPAGLSTNA